MAHAAAATHQPWRPRQDNIDFGTNSATWAWDLFAKVCQDNNVPFAAVGGNHDQQNLQGLTRKQVQAMLGQEPGAKTAMGPDFAENHLNETVSRGGTSPWGDDGHYGNYYIELQRADGSAGGTLYILDSGDSSKFKQVAGADWVWDSQNAWFLNVSRSLAAQRGGKVLPASAWFHIPLPEHYDLLHRGTQDPPPAFNISGVNQEGVSCASVHSGLFTSFVEAGDVKTASVGHDHVNECGPPPPSLRTSTHSQLTARATLCAASVGTTGGLSSATPAAPGSTRTASLVGLDARACLSTRRPARSRRGSGWTRGWARTQRSTRSSCGRRAAASTLPGWPSGTPQTPRPWASTRRTSSATTREGTMPPRWLECIEE